MADKDDPEKWVEVAQTGSVELASLIAGLLQSEGIPVEGADRPAQSWPETIGALGTNRITVPPDRAVEAKELIASREKESGRRVTEPVEKVPGEPEEK